MSFSLFEIIQNNYPWNRYYNLRTGNDKIVTLVVTFITSEKCYYNFKFLLFEFYYVNIAAFKNNAKIAYY